MTPATQTERAGRLERVVERERFLVQGSWVMSTPTENPTVPPIENPTDRRGDEPQFVAAS
jgi:hypothetical protein